VFLRKENVKHPFIININVPMLCFLILPAIMIIVLSGVGFYKSALLITGNVAYQKENLKYKNLVARIDSLENTVKLESKLMDRISNIENDLSLSYGISVLSEDIKKMGIGGRLSIQEKARLLIGSPLENKVLDIEETILSNKRQFDFLKDRLKTVNEIAEKQKIYLSEKPSIYPVFGRITSEFGNRVHPIFEGTSFHEGIDIANLMWTPVIATADGICTYSGVRGSYGLMVEVTHRSSGSVTRYAHLKNANIKVGDMVKRYDIIGNVGSSGVSTGPHLHYEVRVGGRASNPRLHMIDNNSDYIID
jgi:hypothetical protein